MADKSAILVKSRLELVDKVIMLGVKLASIGLALSIWFSPQLLRFWISAAGINEFDGFGVKIVAKLNDQSQDTAAAMQEVSQQLSHAQSDLSGSSPNVSAANAALASALATVSENRNQIQQLLLHSSSAITGAQQADIVAADSGPIAEGWGVIFGADTTPGGGGAKDEIAKAEATGKYKNLQIYRRTKYFLSTVVFYSFTEAAGSLADLQKLSRYSAGAYIVNLANFCPSASPDPNYQGVIDCSSR